MMNKWYSFTPTDTLFCKGAEPMNLGENHTATYRFPPPAHTIAGAVRTAILVQNEISFEDYAKGNVPTDISEAIGEAGKTQPFELIGPLFKKWDDIFIPAPYSWYVENDSLDKQHAKVFRSKKITSPLISTESSDLYWATGETGQLVSL